MQEHKVNGPGVRGDKTPGSKNRKKKSNLKIYLVYLLFVTLAVTGVSLSQYRNMTAGSDNVRVGSFAYNITGAGSELVGMKTNLPATAKLSTPGSFVDGAVEYREITFTNNGETDICVDFNMPVDVQDKGVLWLLFPNSLGLDGDTPAGGSTASPYTYRNYYSYAEALFTQAGVDIPADYLENDDTMYKSDNQYAEDLVDAVNEVNEYSAEALKSVKLSPNQSHTISLIFWCEHTPVYTGDVNGVKYMPEDTRSYTEYYKPFGSLTSLSADDHTYGGGLPRNIVYAGITITQVD